MPTLNQPLGSFSTESRAANFPRCRQECPLLPPINTGGFQGLKRKKIGSKVSQKISLFPVPATFSLSLSLYVCVCARARAHRPNSQPRPPTLSSPAWPLPFPPHSPSPPIASPFSSTVAAAHQRHHFRFLPSPALAATTSAPTSIVTTSLTTIISINPAPHQQQSSHCDLLYLSSAIFCFFSLLHPTTSADHPHFHQSLLSHRPNILITSTTPR